MISVSSDGVLSFQNKNYRCALGKSGTIATDKKREGDRATPLGAYGLLALYWRADKLDEAPQTNLPAFVIRRDDGWCDDPADPNYNKFVKLPYAARHETLWRDDDAYDLVVVIDFNIDPVVPGKGSCIFMHIAKPGYTPTEGCVALSRVDLLEILKHCDVTTKITIHSV